MHPFLRKILVNLILKKYMSQMKKAVQVNMMKNQEVKRLIRRLKNLFNEIVLQTSQLFKCPRNRLKDRQKLTLLSLSLNSRTATMNSF
jgi:hypothetical protein